MTYAAERKEDTRKRLHFLLGGFLLLALVIFLKLFYWQVVRAETLQNFAQSQHKSLVTIPAKRGAILAKDGFPLTTSSEAWLLWASLSNLKETPGEIADKLAPILASEEARGEATESAKTRREIAEEEKERIYSVLTKDAAWVPIKHKISREQKGEIEKLDIAGIGFDPQERRENPEASMAAHLLGFVGKDAAGQDRGYFGLEGYYDLTLSGISGEILRERDAFGLPILFGALRRLNPLDGMSLKTHIDRSVQFVVERELKEGIKRYGAKSGSVVIMRPQDGAILAMSRFPSYEPENYSFYPKDVFLNPVVGESFEPGSIFKVLVMAAALDSGVVEPETKCKQCSGPRRIAEYTMGTWNNEYHPESTMTEVIEHSDNVGMIWVAEKLGAEKLYSYLTAFGIGRPTGADLQDESSPELRPRNRWGLVDLAVASFGQGIAITPLQMVKAVGAIANKGVLVTPQVVDSIISDGREQDIRPQAEGRVISEKTARAITEMMVNATEFGEARWAKPRGFRIAGKTGTAQIPVSGHYDDEKTIASFVGFAPADNPQFVMLVTLREPTTSPWGSETAAPLWFSIAEEIFPILKVHPR